MSLYYCFVENKPVLMVFFKVSKEYSQNCRKYVTKWRKFLSSLKILFTIYLYFSRMLKNKWRKMQETNYSTSIPKNFNHAELPSNIEVDGRHYQELGLRLVLTNSIYTLQRHKISWNKNPEILSEPKFKRIISLITTFNKLQTYLITCVK